MSDSQQILAVIETRLIEAREEIAALQAARGVLTGSTQRTRSAPRTNSRLGGRRRTGVSRSTTGRAPANVAAATLVAPARAKNALAAKRSPSTRAPRAQTLGDGAIERFLRENADGLSAAALTKITGASHARVTARLRDLEQVGEVRSSGSRRTSLWRMVTDEQRIAERAAELENAQHAQTTSRAARQTPQLS